MKKAALYLGIPTSIKNKDQREEVIKYAREVADSSGHHLDNIYYEAFSKIGPNTISKLLHKASKDEIEVLYVNELISFTQSIPHLTKILNEIVSSGLEIWFFKPRIIVSEQKL
jgi:hypothetical protein